MIENTGDGLGLAGRHGDGVDGEFGEQSLGHAFGERLDEAVLPLCRDFLDRLKDALVVHRVADPIAASGGARERSSLGRLRLRR